MTTHMVPDHDLERIHFEHSYILTSLPRHAPCASSQTLLAGNCTSVSPYTSKLTPSTSACYTLKFDSAVYASIFKMDLSGVTNVARPEHNPRPALCGAHS